MARHFDAASSHYLTLGSAIAAAPPFSVSMWAKLDQLPSTYTDEFTVFNLAHADHAGWEGWNLRADDTADKLQFNCYTGSGDVEVAETSVAVTAGTWEHYGAITASTSSRAVYLNGGNKGTNANNEAPDEIDQTNVGCFRFANAFRDFTDGVLAEIGFWNIDLTDAEMLLLSKGYSPLFVRPANLVAYWPLVRGLNDRIGANVLTASGTTVSAHPRIIYPAPIHFNYGEAAAPPAGIPILRRRRECA